MTQPAQDIFAVGIKVVQVLRATQPPLFSGKGADGSRYTFGVLDDGRCAISRDGIVLQAWDYNQVGIDTAVDQYCVLTGPATKKPVSERARAFAAPPRYRSSKGRGHVKQGRTQ